MSGSVLAGTRFSPRARGRGTRPLVARWARRSRVGPPTPGARSASPLRAEPDMADMAGSGRAPPVGGVRSIDLEVRGFDELEDDLGRLEVRRQALVEHGLEDAVVVREL
jgi:hypothetical protein